MLVALPTRRPQRPHEATRASKSVNMPSGQAPRPSGPVALNSRSVGSELRVPDACILSTSCDSNLDTLKLGLNSLTLARSPSVVATHAARQRPLDRP
jgi:hypothetical protein